MDRKRLSLKDLATAVLAGTGLFAALYWSLTRGGHEAGFAGLLVSAAAGAALAAGLVARAARRKLAEPLAAAVDAHRLDTERLSAALAAQAGADAELAHDRRWLEAILRDLNEAVVVAAPDHRILLLNDRAHDLLAPCGPVGLQRDLTTLVAADALAAAHARAGDGGNVSCDVTLCDGRGPYPARLGWVRGADGAREAYVLSVSAPVASSSAAAAPRPEFYDFDLARLKPAGGRVGARKLSALAYVVFDLETTGLDTANDAIVSVGAIRVLGTRILAGESYTTLVDPGRPIPAASTVFHGIDDKAVVGAPSAAQAARAFKLFAHDAVLVAHNAAFDLAFMRRAAAAAGIVIDNPPFDTLMIARWLFPDLADHSLDALARRMGVEIGRRHSALDDARATAEIFVRLVEICERRGIESYDALVETSNMALEIHAAARLFNPAGGP
jgi:DNA polymerase III subunit epsilon